jgi:hypothetical protein
MARRRHRAIDQLIRALALDRESVQADDPRLGRIPPVMGLGVAQLTAAFERRGDKESPVVPERDEMVDLDGRHHATCAQARLT